jgi:hypothetical protein
MSAMNDRRTGPSIGAAGTEMPTVHPVRAERLQAEYAGMPSRIRVFQLPSGVCRLRSTNSGVVDWPT